MLITNKRVNSIDKYISHLESVDEIYVVVENIDEYKNKLLQIGFTEKIEEGERVLPSILGPVSKYNVEGEYELLRDLPKETFYVSQYRTIKAYGKYDTDVCMDIPYKRFQKKLIKLPSEEITILKNKEKKIVSSQLIKVEDKSRIKHIVNLFLEIFGICKIVDNKLNTIQKTEIKRLTWKLLPKGKRDWGKLKSELLEIKKYKTKKEYDIFRRFGYINEYAPDFVAVGIGGFSDYVVFGFEEKDLYILENENSGNATYVFDKDWESLSKLTKMEILNNKLEKERLIHTKNWYSNIRDMINEGDIKRETRLF